jgi:23S rRNA (pseudouridine1915-N3)-methyltransferase
MMGKTNVKPVAELITDYTNRLKHYISTEIVIIPELKTTKNLNEIEQKEKEGALILKNIDKTDEVILLDEKGKMLSSVEFAALIEKRNTEAIKRMIFVVGGAYGFSQEVYNRADGLISLSRMTFPHQLVRAIFMEQLYRAMTIIRGEPYHHV